MKWLICDPTPGSMIRVQAGSIHHYGVFVSDNEVIQFGLAPALRPGQKDADVTVLSTNLTAFRNGTPSETAVFDPEETAAHPTPAEAVATARSRLGEGNYHIIYNNCEHFVYECVTGKHYSEQVEGVREMFRKMMGK